MHAELGGLGHHRRRLDRLLELVDDLTLDGLELGQALHSESPPFVPTEQSGRHGRRRARLRRPCEPVTRTCPGANQSRVGSVTNHHASGGRHSGGGS